MVVGFTAATPGYPLAAFSLSTDSSGGAGTVGVRIMTGIPDREFGDGAHDFLYLPVVAEDGNTWLNHNLGADYTNLNHASFNLTQQATAYDDHLAYGSLYQWGRYSDGHELNTWSRTSGTLVNPTTPTNATTDTPGHGNFITESSDPRDWRDPQNNALWQGAAGVNNPCPQGYRVPTVAEQTALINAASITNYTNAASSNLAFTIPGFNSTDNGVSIYATVMGLYWNTDGIIVSGGAYHYRYMSIRENNLIYSYVYAASGATVRCIKAADGELPPGMTITNADQNKYVVSIYDTDYNIAPDPLPAATLDPIAGDGSPDTEVNIQGVIGTLNSGDELTVSLAYTATAAVDYPAFSQTVSVPSELIEGGGGPIDLTMTYDAGTTVAGAGTITATIAAATYPKRQTAGPLWWWAFCSHPGVSVGGL